MKNYRYLFLIFKAKRLLFLPALASALILMALVASLSGCSSLSARVKDYCRSVSAQEKGRTEALQGLPESSIETDADFKRCLKYGVPIDYKLYKQGRTEGLKEFCTAKKGFEQGQKGIQYHNICPKKMEEVFLKAYKQGDKKCLFTSGNNQAMNGQPLDFKKSSCQKLSGSEGQVEHSKGWKQGQKKFCSYDKGYNDGLRGEVVHPICVVKKGLYYSGYNKGTKKCYFNKGYNEATNGKKKSIKTASFIGGTACKTLIKKSNQVQYNAGWSQGIKDFCTSVTAYNFGSKGGKYQNTCPKAIEDNFFKAYIKGLEEYKAEQRQQQLLFLERERMRAEKRDRQRALRLQEQSIQLQEENMISEERYRQSALRLQEEKIQAESRDRKEHLRLKMMDKYRLCRFDSDCGPHFSCRYNYEIKAKVCR